MLKEMPQLQINYQGVSNWIILKMHQKQKPPGGSIWGEQSKQKFNFQGKTPERLKSEKVNGKLFPSVSFSIHEKFLKEK